MNFTQGAGGRVDWKAERERIDLAAVATRFLGPATGRRGERGKKLWWCCPFHQDKNPSFCVEPGKPWWHCFGCGESGDAANLVMRLDGLTFPEAVERLTGGPLPLRRAGGRPAKPSTKPRPEPTGLPEAEAMTLVEEAAERLWEADGAEALAYLTGPGRCLSVETIKAARLGWVSRASIPKADGLLFQAAGWVVPWFEDGRLVLVKIRQPESRRPKYVEAYRDPARLVCYPSPEAIEPGRPLVVVEGEFDALVLGQALGELAAVVTLGSASSRPSPLILGRMLSASPWYVATDGDEAGNRSAVAWPASARRVRPPGPHKDWTEAAAAKVGLSRWWAEVLSGNPCPSLYSWEEMSQWRWDGADDSPGLDVPRIVAPSPGDPTR